jgi:hypothetical protein
MRFLSSLTLTGALASLLYFAACTGNTATLGDAGAGDATTGCTPGMSIACVGAGGCAGGQVCSHDGTHFEPCDCAHPGDDSGADTAGNTGDDATSGDDAGPGPDGNVVADSSGVDAPVVGCPAGLTCNVACPGGATTTIKGTVYDPAARNPLFNVAVYVPAEALPSLPRGVPTGANACSCAALFPSASVASTTTGPDGTFVLPNAPVGSAVPLVLQVGKWRRVVHVNVAPCQANAQPDKSLALPATVAAGSEDNMPDIAVSTGAADTLECLLRRVGLPATEYVAGPGGPGHVHVFSGGGTAPLTGAIVGSPENPPMPGAPASPTALWATAGQLMAYDITLLSCEGGETYNANPPALESYLNAGGRVFASHYHYAWFSGPIASVGSNTYAAPADWGAHLATWADDTANSAGVIGGIVDTALNGTMMSFPKGIALERWLMGVGGLGQNGVPPAELSIYQPRFNATVAPTNTASQPWITADNASTMPGKTMAFSFNTPVNAPPGTGGMPHYCGRAVFSDLHVAGDPSTVDTPPPPGGCAPANLSPQERALEFILFDLSGCVVPDSATP